MQTLKRHLKLMIYILFVLSSFLWQCTNPEVALPEDDKNKAATTKQAAPKLFETPTIMVYPADSSPLVFYYFFALAEVNGAKDNLLFPVKADLKKLQKAMEVFEEFYGEKPVILGIRTPKDLLIPEVLENAARVVVVDPDEEVKKIKGLTFVELPKEGEAVASPTAAAPAFDATALKKTLEDLLAELKKKPFIEKTEVKKQDWTLALDLPKIPGFMPKDALKGMIQGMFLQEKMGIFIDAEPFEKKLEELKLDETQLGDPLLANKAVDAYQVRFLLFASVRLSTPKDKPIFEVDVKVYDDKAGKIAWEKKLELAPSVEEKKKEAEKTDEKKSTDEEVKKGPPAKRLPDLLSDLNFVAGILEKVSGQSPTTRTLTSDELIYLKGKTIEKATLLLYEVEEKENKEKFKLAATKEGYFSPFVFNPKAPFVITVDTDKEKYDFYIRGLAHSYSFFELMPTGKSQAEVVSVFWPLNWKEFKFSEEVQNELNKLDKKIFYRLRISQAEKVSVKENDGMLELGLPEKEDKQIKWQGKFIELKKHSVYMILD